MAGQTAECLTAGSSTWNCAKWVGTSRADARRRCTPGFPGCRDPPVRSPDGGNAGQDRRGRRCWEHRGSSARSPASSRYLSTTGSFSCSCPSSRLRPRYSGCPRDHGCAATWIVHRNWCTDPSVPPGRRNADISKAPIRTVIWQGHEDRWPGYSDASGVCAAARLGAPACAGATSETA